MSHSTAATTDPGQPAIYQIRLKGHLGSQWTNWFEGLAHYLVRVEVAQP